MGSQLLFPKLVALTDNLRYDVVGTRMGRVRLTPSDRRILRVGLLGLRKVLNQKPFHCTSNFRLVAADATDANVLEMQNKNEKMR